MHFSSWYFASLFAAIGFAHTYLDTLKINGTELEQQRCCLPPWDDENYPVMDPSSEDMICRSSDMFSTKTETCWVEAGSTVTIHMTESGGDSRFISPSHRGPVLAYMAPMASKGKGAVWFKIFEEGRDNDKDYWAVDRINEAKGYFDVVIPADIAPGDYYLRPEVIALHEGNREFGEDEDAGAQYYNGCIQLHVTGTGTSVPPGVDMTMAYGTKDPGILYNLWDGEDYVIPGPPLYVPGTSNSATATGVSPTASGTAPVVAITPTPQPPTAGSCVSKRGNKGHRKSRNKKRGNKKSRRRNVHIEI